jgi:hypothetical protein
MSGAVQAWFGPAFADLHPLLQQLHQQGGVLEGEVAVGYGAGLAGVVGRAVARKLGLRPGSAPQRLRVGIGSQDGQLHWDRSFNGEPGFRSTFRPIGHYPSGYWLEASGHLTLRLRVAVIDGAWHWLPGEVCLGGVRLPAWITPRVRASKQAVGDRYRFQLAIDFPVLGTVLEYGGCLDFIAALPVSPG